MPETTQLIYQMADLGRFFLGLVDIVFSVSEKQQTSLMALSGV